VSSSERQDAFSKLMAAAPSSKTHHRGVVVAPKQLKEPAVVVVLEDGGEEEKEAQHSAVNLGERSSDNEDRSVTRDNHSRDGVPKRSIMDVLMTKKSRRAPDDSGSAPKASTTDTQTPHSSSLHDKTDPLKSATKEESETMPVRTKSSVTSAFSVMMSAAAELSRPECFVFDFAAKRCDWFESLSAFENSPSSLSSWSSSATLWRQHVKLGRGASQNKVLLIGRNLPVECTSHSTSSVLNCDPLSRLSVGVLKSIMQKAFRRMDSETCRRAACEIAVKSWTDLVRRAPIVILEDGFANSWFAPLVWVMLADSVGLKPSPELAKFVVDVLAASAEQPLLDSNGWSAGFDATQAGPLMRSDLAGMTHPDHAGLIFSMQARALFGGMGGDVMMCKAYARVWYNRLSGREGQEVQLVFAEALQASGAPHTTSSFLGLCGFDHSYNLARLSPGVDFHCQPRLFESVVKNANVNMEDFRRAMWHFRSGVNFRGRVETNSRGEPIVPLIIPTPETLEGNRRRYCRMEKGLDGSYDGENVSLFEVWQKVALECERESLEYLRNILAQRYS